MPTEKNKKKILIVEDERPLLNALAEKFTYEGFDALTAVNGVEGLEKALTDHPDLILLDIIMPIMDGVTMLERLRAQKEGKNIPIVILTNLGEPPKRLLNANTFREYLVKANWKINDVVEKVKSVLENAKS